MTDEAYHDSLAMFLGCRKVSLSTVRDDSGFTLIHQASLEARPEIITTLFDAGLFREMFPLHATGECSNYKDMTAMDIAKKLRFINVQDELQRCKDVDDSMNWLHHSCRSGNINIVKKILEKHPGLIEQEASDHTTPLFWAVTSGVLVVMKLLVAKSADVFCRSGKGDTLLTRTVSLNQRSLVKYLIKTCGLDPDMSGAAGKSPLQIAIENNDLDMVKELIQAGSTPIDGNFPHLAMVGNKEMMDFILEKFSLDINFQDRKGRCPLFFAVEQGRIEIVKDLLKRRADPKIKDRRQR